MNFYETVCALCQTPGPSGFEGPAAAKAAELLAPLVDTVETDRLGSVIGRKKCGVAGAKTILLDAHLDEVGFIVTGQEKGFLKVGTLGGIDPRVMPNREVTILSQPNLFGVTAVKPPHVTGGESEVTPIRELYIDAGLTEQEARALCPIGTPVIYREPMIKLNDDRIAGKSLDDRACFAILLRTLELLRGEELDVDVVVLGSCFEETSGDGARVATFAQHPDYAIAVDVTFGKTHDGPADVGFELGKGPAVGIGPNCADWMVKRLRSCAMQERINWNPEITAGETGTNGWDMQTAREGVPTAIVSLPLNYMHTPLEVISQWDGEQCARMLACFIRRLGEEAPV